MDAYIGIDLGTSAAKLMLVSGDGEVLASVVKEYPIYYPASGWSEQNPGDWFTAVADGIRALLQRRDKNTVKGISFGGQMHGLVILDRDGGVIRPAILWNDGRTQKETDYLNGTVGKERLYAYTANIAFAGFTAPKILWVKKNEPDNFKKAAKIMLPKDYLAYRLTGAHCTDYSDASGTLLLDVKNRRWSREMLAVCSTDEAVLPKLCESFEPVGTLLPAVADELGLSRRVAVAAGAGDNAAAAVGNGAVANGACNISIGTSGTVFIAGDTFGADPQNGLHSFCHANGKYHLLGCILSAAACSKWWTEDILKTGDHAAEQTGAERYIGKNDVFFLPYLMGERSPHNDVSARGAFIGMRPGTTRGQMTLAVLEGVAFALKDCAEAAKVSGFEIRSARVCGGGANSPLWKQIIADVLDVPLELPAVKGGPAYGAAILAMVAAGRYKNVEEAADKLVKIEKRVLPQKANEENYRERYGVFKTLYPALKDAFKLM
ncbi:MAG: xylulokinase [Clostridiales bacterium]|jgi:xylulokinase|nr:xylulokinase [Clostridiales bacterium]